MNEWNERNRGVIEGFRAKHGDTGSRPLLLLTTTGARSGRRHTTPLMYLSDGGRLAVFASKGGSAGHPDWFHNIVANPAVTVEVGNETFETEAQVAEPEERERLYKLQSEQYPMFAGYQQKVKRRIPVVLIQRKET